MLIINLQILIQSDVKNKPVRALYQRRIFDQDSFLYLQNYNLNMLLELQTAIQFGKGIRFIRTSVFLCQNLSKFKSRLIWQIVSAGSSPSG